MKIYEFKYHISMVMLWIKWMKFFENQQLYMLHKLDIWETNLLADFKNKYIKNV